MVRIIESAKGNSNPKSLSKEEIKYREFQKKSIVSSRRIYKGEKLDYNNVAFIRAEKLGLPPSKINNIIGKNLKYEIEEFHIITESDLL